MAFVKPIIFFDTGFQLSVGSTLGILLFSDPLRKVVGKIYSLIFKISPAAQLKMVNATSDILLISISAQIFSTLISAAAFNSISYISIPANILIAPLQPVIMIGGMFSLILETFASPLGKAVAKIVQFAPALTIRIVDWLSNVSWASQYYAISYRTAWTIIICITLIWVYRQVIFRKTTKNIQWAAVFSLSALAVLIWVKGLNYMDKKVAFTVNLSDSKPVMRLRLNDNQNILIASNQSAYTAFDLINKVSLTSSSPDMAVIDFSDSWMKKSFLEQESSLPELLILDGAKILSNSKGTDLYEEIRLPSSFSIQSGDVRLEMLMDYLKQRLWKMNYKELKILIPTGIKIKWIHKSELMNRIMDVSVILIGKQDDKKEWEQFIQTEKDAFSGKPLLLDASDKESLTIYSDGSRFWIVQ